MKPFHLFFVAIISAFASLSLYAADCNGVLVPKLGGLDNSLLLDDGTIIGNSKMMINIDGYKHAYHPENLKAGALIHLCNAGKVFLPNGVSYHGSIDNATCTGRFMNDFKMIRNAGWTKTDVGVIEWYGILAHENVILKGNKISGIKPVYQNDEEGFFISPTALFDRKIVREDNQERYINPLVVPFAVASKSMLKKGLKLGSYGVAYNKKTKKMVPFIVGDVGPKIGEGSPALARSLANKPIKDPITNKERFVGSVDDNSIFWVFFNDKPLNYDKAQEINISQYANQAFENWGGKSRLNTCLRQPFASQQ
ncbi:glycoside hydrolase family 75 protein [Erwinia billingiae]|uniref:glycoside hydrolase family 75 protein n=1 Tax=Erwinia billingiae TaxID=182337 RepID=UPI000CFE5503|nr:glycoside hydrolase family 75 protein [Erwinia billingiae]PRB60483.1 hypothetical protein CQ001_10060 [Erwinia billingiae]